MKRVLFFAVITGLVFVALQNPEKIKLIFLKIFSVFSPFIIGFCFTFIFNVPLNFFERKVLKNLKASQKVKRALSLILTYLSVLSVILIIYFFVVPELKRSFGILFENLPDYVTKLGLWIEKTAERFNVTGINPQKWREFLDSLRVSVGQNMPKVIGSTMDAVRRVVGSVAKVLIGFTFSVYVLLQKEKLSKNLKKVLFAFVDNKKVKTLLSVAKLSNEIFAKFVFGQFTEVIIIGVLCFLGMKIFSMPYALLISVIISITAFIPFFGAFIGTGFGVLLLLVIKPVTALWFVIFIIVLQQIEGNFIYPRVVGSSIGLPGIWVLSAVVLGSNLFGVVGMLLAVPVSAVFYTIFKDLVNKKLGG